MPCLSLQWPVGLAVRWGHRRLESWASVVVDTLPWSLTAWPWGRFLHIGVTTTKFCTASQNSNLQHRPSATYIARPSDSYDP